MTEVETHLLNSLKNMERGYEELGKRLIGLVLECQKQLQELEKQLQALKEELEV